MVEMAVIGIGLCFAREYFYDSLLPMEQDRLIAWLNQINLYDMPKNNWRFFRILVNIGFRKVGRAADEKRLKEVYLTNRPSSIRDNQIHRNIRILRGKIRPQQRPEAEAYRSPG